MGKKYSVEKLLPAIVELSKEAGETIMEIYRQGDLGTTYKDGGSPLTLSDTAAHNIILEQLKKITPTIPVISEESRSILYEDRKEWNLFWLVDPLDGTKEFIKGNGEFTVIIKHLPMSFPICIA